MGNDNGKSKWKDVEDLIAERKVLTNDMAFSLVEKRSAQRRIASELTELIIHHTALALNKGSKPTADAQRA